jgi:MoxR-like ATPase
MEERQVTVDGETRALSEPFLVLATQNPIELAGTYPLPEAQLDRFLLRVTLGYPTLEDEHQILLRFERDEVAELIAVTTPTELVELQHLRGSIEVSDDVRSYLVDLARATREDERVSLGASPRAALALHRAVQARALLQGRSFVLPDDVKALVVPVLSHRLVLTPAARLRGVTPAQILEEIVGRLDVPVEDEGDEDTVSA